jgi:hypothetical protein
VELNIGSWFATIHDFPPTASACFERFWRAQTMTPWRFDFDPISLKQGKRSWGGACDPVRIPEAGLRLFGSMMTVELKLASDIRDADG